MTDDLPDRDAVRRRTSELRVYAIALDALAVRRRNGSPTIMGGHATALMQDAHFILQLDGVWLREFIGDAARLGLRGGGEFDDRDPDWMAGATAYGQFMAATAAWAAADMAATMKEGSA